jgi:hypothetical protein
MITNLYAYKSHSVCSLISTTHQDATRCICLGCCRHSCLSLDKCVRKAIIYKNGTLCEDLIPTDQPSTCHPVCTSAATSRSQTSNTVRHQDPESRPEQHMTIDVRLDDTLHEATPEKGLLQADTDISVIIALCHLQ